MYILYMALCTIFFPTRRLLSAFIVPPLVPFLCNLFYLNLFHLFPLFSSFFHFLYHFPLLSLLFNNASTNMTSVIYFQINAVNMNQQLTHILFSASCLRLTWTARLMPEAARLLDNLKHSALKNVPLAPAAWIQVIWQSLHSAAKNSV